MGEWPSPELPSPPGGKVRRSPRARTRRRHPRTRPRRPPARSRRRPAPRGSALRSVSRSFSASCLVGLFWCIRPLCYPLVRGIWRERIKLLGNLRIDLLVAGDRRLSDRVLRRSKCNFGSHVVEHAELEPGVKLAENRADELRARERVLVGLLDAGILVRDPRLAV